ncbi:hypothetical protein GCM10017776_10210 [Streptomyces griseoluteus]|nr:hypothetical protein GCM10017776_10210 [Streptomyces griseoluteus]
MLAPAPSAGENRPHGRGTAREAPDGHFVVVNGRRRRATDPGIPEDVAARLRRHLMAGRRGVRDAEDGEAERVARGRVQEAKVALGEAVVGGVGGGEATAVGRGTGAA